MGYDVHITRAEDWSDNQGFEISTEEWLNLIQNDPELTPMPESEKYSVVWHGPTQYSETWLDWADGNIYTKNPDKATLRKMWQVAQRLNAKIQGDDGEIYDEREINEFDDSYLNPNQVLNELKKPLHESPLLSFVRRLFKRK
jgi:hypothetical protein